MEHPFYRETWAEINLDAIGHNIKQMRQKLPKTTQIMAVVKANGYGHGSIEVAKKALKTGATALAVALLEEAIELREAGITVPILVLGWVSPKGAIAASEHDITITFYQESWIYEVDRYPLDRQLKVHLKCDTGMGRAGINTNEELTQILHALKKSPHIHLTGVYTHFASADEEDLTYYYKQRTRFKELLVLFKKSWSAPVDFHIGNSAASIRHPNDMYQMIRFGISMYGIHPSIVMKNEKAIHLNQAFSLHSRLVHVKKVTKGTPIGYGGTYVSEVDEWIGTIPIGYGDGWIRKLQGADVLIEGKRFPIIGRICMDQMMVQLDKDFAVGTKVTLIGEQMGDMIEMVEVADYLDTISYEVPCIINNRIPRFYIESEQD